MGVSARLLRKRLHFLQTLRARLGFDFAVGRALAARSAMSMSKSTGLVARLTSGTIASESSIASAPQLMGLR